MILFAAINSRVVTALIVVAGLVVFGALLLATAAGELRGRRKAKVPVGFRPAPSDEELESKVLVRTLLWGVLGLILISLWIPAYWLHEPTRLASKKKAIAAETVDQGKTLYESLCFTCHGMDLEGQPGRAVILNGKSFKYDEPPLRYIYSRYEAAGRNADDITQLIYDAINRGRPPGTPMPTWGLAFGGPLNSRQVDTLVAFIQSKQQPFPHADSIDGKTLFLNYCVRCHSPDGWETNPALIGTGSIGPNLTVALSRQDRDAIFKTIHDGRLNVNRPSMPAWAGLGDPAIEALVQFIESIQRS